MEFGKVRKYPQDIFTGGRSKIPSLNTFCGGYCRFSHDRSSIKAAHSSSDSFDFTEEKCISAHRNKYWKQYTNK